MNNTSYTNACLFFSNSKLKNEHLNKISLSSLYFQEIIDFIYRYHFILFLSLNYIQFTYCCQGRTEGRKDGRTDDLMVDCSGGSLTHPYPFKYNICKAKYFVVLPFVSFTFHNRSKL